MPRRVSVDEVVTTFQAGVGDMPDVTAEGLATWLGQQSWPRILGVLLQRNGYALIKTCHHGTPDFSMMAECLREKLDELAADLALANRLINARQATKAPRELAYAMAIPTQEQVEV